MVVHLAAQAGVRYSLENPSAYISSNIVQNYLLSDKIPNSFNQTVTYFKKYKNCILVFIKDPNLKSVSATLKDYENKKNLINNFNKFTD